ncbi:MAG: transcription-repair coupling factor, partial [Gammaproteobacteria bacterium]
MNSVPTDSSLLSLPLPLPTGAATRRGWRALPGCGEALSLARLRTTHAGFWLIIVPSVARADSLEAELRFFLGTQAGLAVFPDTEVLPYDTFSPHQDLTSRRLMVLRDVAAGRISTLIVAASTLLPRLAPARYIGGY